VPKSIAETTQFTGLDSYLDIVARWKAQNTSTLTAEETFQYRRPIMLITTLTGTTAFSPVLAEGGGLPEPDFPKPAPLPTPMALVALIRGADDCAQGERLLKMWLSQHDAGLHLPRRTARSTPTGGAHD